MHTLAPSMLFRSLRHSVRRYSDASASHNAIHNSLKSIEESYVKLGLDTLKSHTEVESLLSAGKINQHTADYVKHNITRRQEAAKAGDYWKRLFLFIGVPSIVLVAVNTYKLEEEHNKHLEEHPPAFTPYEHMRIRAKKFFWGDGDSALFQHPKFKQ